MVVLADDVREGGHDTEPGSGLEGQRDQRHLRVPHAEFGKEGRGGGGVMGEERRREGSELCEVVYFFGSTPPPPPPPPTSLLGRPAVSC